MQAHLTATLPMLPIAPAQWRYEREVMLRSRNANGVVAAATANHTLFLTHLRDRSLTAFETVYLPREVRLLSLLPPGYIVERRYPVRNVSDDFVAPTHRATITTLHVGNEAAFVRTVATCHTQTSLTAPMQVTSAVCAAVRVRAAYVRVGHTQRNTFSARDAMPKFRPAALAAHPASTTVEAGALVPHPAYCAAVLPEGNLAALGATSVRDGLYFVAATTDEGSHCLWVKSRATFSELIMPLVAAHDLAAAGGDHCAASLVVATVRGFDTGARR